MLSVTESNIISEDVYKRQTENVMTDVHRTMMTGN